MAEAAVIAKVLMSAESAQQAAKGDNTSWKPSKRISQSVDDPAQTTGAYSKNTSDNVQDTEMPAKQPFARVLNAKLEKRDTKTNEEKKKSSPETMTGVISVPAEGICQKTNVPLRVHIPTKSSIAIGKKENSVRVVKPSQNMQKSGLSPSVKTPAKETSAQFSNQIDRTKNVQLLHQKPAVKEQAPNLPNASPAKPDSSKETRAEVPVNKNTQAEIIDKPREKTDQVYSHKINPAQSQDKAPLKSDPINTDKAVQSDKTNKPKNIPAVYNSQEKGSKPAFPEVKQQAEHVHEKSKSSSLQEQKDSSTPKNFFSGSESKSSAHEDAWSHTHTSQQISSTEPQISHSQVMAQSRISPTLISPSSQSGPFSDTMTPAQQIIRSIQTDYNHDIQRINLTLSPAGLGMVRIHFQRTGEEISGLLEIEKTETRQEIEKSLPQILSVLDSQGIQIRKIDIASSTNSHQRQSGFDNTNEWTLNREMEEQGQNRNRSLGSTDDQKTGTSLNEIINHGNKERYNSNTGLENLNMFA